MRRWVLPALGWLTLACLTMPVFYTVWVSFSPGSFLSPPVGEWSLRWYRAFVDDGRWSSALFRSLVIGVASAGVALFTGVPLAFALGRHRFLGRKVLAGAVLLPVCVPPAALGMGMLPLLYMVQLWGNPFGLVLAHGLLSLPITYMVARTHLGQIDPDLELAARGLGAGPWHTTLRVTLPLLRPALLAGSAAAFALSLNESMLALFLATPTTETIPAVVWPNLRYSPSPLVAVASCVSASVALAAATFLAWITHPGPGTSSP